MARAFRTKDKRLRDASHHRHRHVDLRTLSGNSALSSPAVRGVLRGSVPRREALTKPTADKLRTHREPTDGRSEMRTRWPGFIVIGFMLLSGCATQPSSPPSPESLRTSATIPDGPAENSTPSDTPETQSPATEQPEQEAVDETVECPAGIELPEDIDPHACGPIPDDANKGGRGERFISPSANIACLMQEDGVMCEARDTTMISDLDNPEGDGRCNGFMLNGGANYLCASVPMFWDGLDHDAAEWPTMPYGSTVFVSEHVCSSESSGVTCWNSRTGHGFLLSKSRYTHW